MSISMSKEKIEIVSSVSGELLLELGVEVARTGKQG
jgi:hypothetical protein